MTNVYVLSLSIFDDATLNRIYLVLPLLLKPFSFFRLRIYEMRLHCFIAFSSFFLIFSACTTITSISVHLGRANFLYLARP